MDHILRINYFMNICRERVVEMGRTKKYTVYCPICGKELLRSVLTKADIKCPKCRTILGVEVENGKVSVSENLKIAE